VTAPHTYAQRAAELAEVEAEHDALAARIRRDHALGRVVLPEDRVALDTLRAHIRRLRHYALRWRVTCDAEAPVSVETFDAAEDGVTLGAHAIVDRRDPVALRAEVRETTVTTQPGWRSTAAREAEHLAAARQLCDANGWEGATIDRAGERWEP